jgi:hypothetical protein
MALLKAYPRCIVIETASPPVSPRVVAATFMTQKANVTSGTLLEFSSKDLLTGQVVD